MKKYFLIIICMISTQIFADSIINYMNIANNIPRMEIKADSDSQAWARSARNVLLLTADSIAETLVLMNENSNNKPLFCMPKNTLLKAEDLDMLIRNTYKELTALNKDSMTVSQVALIGLTKKYPCNSH